MSADTLTFGQRNVGSSTEASVTVSNCGDAAFSFTDVSAHAATNAAYRIDRQCVTGMTLAPRDACTIDVYFEPKAPGQASGAVWLHNTTSTPDQLLTFYGRGVDAQAGTAVLAFEPSMVDFGAQPIGVESPALVITLRNLGPQPLVPSALVLNGANPYDFRGTSGASDCGVGRAIAAGSGCTLSLFFNPRAAGPRRATLVVDAPQLASLAYLTIEGDGVEGPELNQQGLTGSWYEAATSGQGFEVEMFPNLVGPGVGLAHLGWFTFDTTAGAADRQRWYTLSGNVQQGQSTASLTIYRNVGGNFNALPVTNGVAVGTATVGFSTCTTGELTYNFTDGSGLSGKIPLTRLTRNDTCSATRNYPTNADSALGGNWYAAEMSGQGFTIDVSPGSATLFVVWYTYAPNGASAGAAGQRWYTAQGAFAPGMRTIPFTLYATTGGILDSTAATPHSDVVGTGTLAFIDCSSATFSFTFTGGSSSGSSGSISLTRIGPVPVGCA